MIKRIIVWLSRIGHCRGFGIQSPWAYSFVCDVINERWPYYSYERLEEKYRDEGAMKRRLARLYLRIANFMQPDVVLCLGKDSEMCREYVSSGCLKALLMAEELKANLAIEADRNPARKAETNTDKGTETDVKVSTDTNGGSIRQLIWVAADDDSERHVAKAVGMLADGDMLIVEGIHKGRRMKVLWKDVSHQDHIIAFDLYYCGIIYKDSRRYAQNYIVNF